MRPAVAPLPPTFIKDRSPARPPARHPADADVAAGIGSDGESEDKTTSVGGGERGRGEHLICRQAAMSGLARKEGLSATTARAQPCLKSCCASIFVSQKLLRSSVRFRQRRLCIIERMKEKGITMTSFKVHQGLQRKMSGRLDLHLHASLIIMRPPPRGERKGRRQEA